MFSKKIFQISNEVEFNRICLEVFQFQYSRNPTYQKFCKLLKRSPNSVKDYTQIPFLPIAFFKSKKIVTSKTSPEISFTSSGTTGSTTSKHHVLDLQLYKNSFTKSFEKFYGNVEDYIILALLPSYLERQGSSLIFMVDSLIKSSKHKESGFYLNNLNELALKLTHLDKTNKKIVLIGVSFALLDLVENHQFKLNNTVVMETGGMKGRRKELIRNELHSVLKKGFGVDQIHSEYGMTELLSQAYSKGNGIFECPPWMRIFIRDPEDALSYLPPNKTGGINVIDLANLNSCSFIATQDLGKKNQNAIEIMGRFDNSDVRGCNLLVI